MFWNTIVAGLFRMKISRCVYILYGLVLLCYDERDDEWVTVGYIKIGSEIFLPITQVKLSDIRALTRSCMKPQARYVISGSTVFVS